jgi:hypothetical protein
MCLVDDPDRCKEPACPDVEIIGEQEINMCLLN